MILCAVELPYSLSCTLKNVLYVYVWEVYVCNSEHVCEEFCKRLKIYRLHYKIRPKILLVFKMFLSESRSVQNLKVEDDNQERNASLLIRENT